MVAANSKVTARKICDEKINERCVKDSRDKTVDSSPFICNQFYLRAKCVIMTKTEEEFVIDTRFS